MNSDPKHTFKVFLHFKSKKFCNTEIQSSSVWLIFISPADDKIKVR